MSKIRIALLGFISILLLTLSACGNEEAKSSDDIKALVDEYSANFETNEMAAITSHELIITTEDEEEITHDLPEDEFFVSIAPYFDQTHP